MKCPFEYVIKEGTGEGIEFDKQKSLLTILEAYGLSEQRKGAS
jgi:hypothetical protein